MTNQEAIEILEHLKGVNPQSLHKPNEQIEAYDAAIDALKCQEAWHEGSEVPQMYVDPTTGAKWNTFALCVGWYDGWHPDLCKVTEEGKFESMTSGDVFESKFFDYWAYTDDLIPWRLYEELCPTPITKNTEIKL